MTRRAIDHVIVVVDDLDTAATTLLDGHGLASLPGGRHTGQGTANRIVPMGDTYLELLSVIDDAEAARSAMGRWALASRGPGLTAAGVCLRTDDADEEAARLGLDPLAMSRVRPDGVVLSWRLVGAAEMFTGAGLPFFIQWDDLSLHPGRSAAPHRASIQGITGVAMRGDVGALRTRIGGDDLPLTISSGDPAISATISTASGPVVIG